MRLALSFELARRRICDRFKVPVSARARRQARPGQGSDGLPSLRERALRCSRSWPVAELTSLATFKQAATSQSTKREYARASSSDSQHRFDHSDHSDHSERRALCSGPEDRASQGTLSKAKGKQTEPRRRTALGPAPRQRKRTVNFCNGPSRNGTVERTCAGAKDKGPRSELRGPWPKPPLPSHPNPCWPEPRAPTQRA